MQLSVAENNFDILLNLQPYEKLIVDEHGNMIVDSRYVQSIRRRITRDSKKDILLPLEQTFNTIKISDEAKINALKQIEVTFKQTYPSFRKLIGDDKEKGVIQKLLKECESRLAYANTGKTLSSLLDLKMFELNREESPRPKEKTSDSNSANENSTLVDALLKSTPIESNQPSNTTSNSPSNTSSNQSNTQATIASQQNWNMPLTISHELSSFLRVPETSKLTSKEIEYALHRYVLNNKLYKSTAKTIILDASLAKLCGLDFNVTNEITNTSFKTFVFSRHVQKNI